MFYFNRYPETVSQTRTPCIHILVRCGIGDIFTFLTRLPALKEKYPGSRIYFHVGGWAGIPIAIADVLKPYSREVDGVFVLEGYQGHSERRMNRMLRYLKTRMLPGDVLLNWIPQRAPFEYEMRLPFRPRLFKEDKEFVESFFKEKGLSEDNVIAVHPITTKGNSSDFEEERFWSKDRWQTIVDILKGKGFKLLLIGAKGEEYGIKADDKDIYSFQGTEIRQTISALTMVRGLVGTNSWCWEVTGYMGKPVGVVWPLRPEDIDLHVPEGKPMENAIFEVEKQGDPVGFCERFLKML